jgi:aldehyde:ferredoxin oxidoreductase
MKVKTGKYAGYVGDEPEYEAWAHWGSGIGQEDQIAAFVLSNETDRLGMDTNHAGWLIAWLMECYEKKLITKDDLDGINMVWGNADAAMAMLRKIALRQGIGDILAKGILHAVKYFGPEAGKLAIYTHKGNTPRAHDHRSRWHMMLDTCISDTGTDEGSTLPMNPWDVGLSKDTDPFSPEVVAKIVAAKIYRMPFDDSLVMCRFNNRGPGINMDYLANLLKVITGWDITEEEATTIGYRIVNLLRTFNIRHGLSVELDKPSIRYSSAPSDGPFQGISIKPVWMDIVKNFYKLMGWDVQTGKPLPQTLKELDIEHVIKDIW